MIGGHKQSWYRDEWCHFIAKLWASTFTATSARDPYDLLPSETRDITRYSRKFKMSLCNYCADVLFPKLLRNHIFHGLQSIDPPEDSPPEYRHPIVLPSDYGKFNFYCRYELIVYLII